MTFAIPKGSYMKEPLISILISILFWLPKFVKLFFSVLFDVKGSLQSPFIYIHRIEPIENGP